MISIVDHMLGMNGLSSDALQTAKVRRRQVSRRENVLPLHLARARTHRSSLIVCGLLDVRYAPIATKFCIAAKRRDAPEADSCTAANNISIRSPCGNSFGGHGRYSM
jgi:hypothetical protein